MCKMLVSGIFWFPAQKEPDSTSGPLFHHQFKGES
jgi:hypothetical protein